MPMPEGLSELTFAGMLGGRRFRYLWHEGQILSADADFVITGIIRKGETKTRKPLATTLATTARSTIFPLWKSKMHTTVKMQFGTSPPYYAPPGGLQLRLPHP